MCISVSLLAESRSPQSSKNHVRLALLTVKYLVPLTSVSVSILMAAATGSQPQHFLALCQRTLKYDVRRFSLLGLYSVGVASLVWVNPLSWF